MLTVRELFAGIGGIGLGFEMAGRYRVVWQVENDEYCNKVLEKHWPKVRRFGDIRECTGKELGYADVITGGFPCQDISNAGKRKGIRGSRSSLWSEMARLVGEIRPRYVLVENVAALLRRGIHIVLGDLASLGYDAEWDCIPAAAVGAHHRRDRVFIVAYPNHNRPHREGRQETVQQPKKQGIQPQEGKQPIMHKPPYSDKNVEDPNSEGLEGCPRKGIQIGAGNRIFAGPVAFQYAGWWQKDPAEEHPSTESYVGRVAYGIPNRVDRIKCIGNAVVPQVAQFIGERIWDFHISQLSK